MFDWIFELVAGRKEPLSISMRQKQQQQRRIEIEAVWRVTLQPEAAAWMEEELHIPASIQLVEIERPDSIQLVEIDDEQAIEAAIKPENRILTLQGMMFQPRNQTLSEEQAAAAAAASTIIEQEVSPPETLTLSAAAKLLHKLAVQYSDLHSEYKHLHYNVGRSLDRRLKPLFDGYLRSYQDALFFTDTEDPTEMNQELNNLLQKRNQEKALLEESLEESRKLFLAKYEEIRKLALEVAQLERDITQECRADDNNNKGGWLTWLYAAATLYAFKILFSFPSIH